MNVNLLSLIKYIVNYIKYINNKAESFIIITLEYLHNPCFGDM